MDRFVFIAQEAGGDGAWWALFSLAAWVLLVVAMWRVFTKAGKPGWASIIPIYNAYVLLKIVGRPGWWLVLYLIPLVNIVIWVIVSLDLASSFGKSALFAVGIIFLPYIFWLILGFDSSVYLGPGGARGVPGATPQT